MYGNNLFTPFGAIVDPMKKFEKMSTKRVDGTDDRLTAMQMKQTVDDGDPKKRNMYHTAMNLETTTGAGQHATTCG